MIIKKMVVLGRQLSHSAPPLVRAIRAYRQLGSFAGHQDHFTVKTRPRTIPRLRPADIEALAAGYRAGVTVYELAERFGIHAWTVSKYLRAAGVQMRRQPLTVEQIEEATRLYRTGLSVADVGERLGVHGSTINLTLRRHGVAMRSPWDHPRQRGGIANRSPD